MSTEIEVYVKTIEGRTYKIDIEPEEKITELKKRIYDKEGIHPDSQSLIYKGTVCDDEKTLKDYNVESGGGFHMTKKVPSGSK
mgnify:FL=1